MFPIDLSGKKGVVFGVANDRSIAWGITQALSQAGARIALTYQGDRLKERVEGLAANLENPLTLPCDATDDDQIVQVFETLKEEFGDISFVVHSIAFANKDDLSGRYADTGREGYRMALEISAYSLLPMVRHAAPLMTDGGSVLALTFDASQRVYPGYNVMGTAKAALEHGVRQLAFEFGEQNIRVNAISAGPLETLAARGISGFRDMRHAAAYKAPLKRNITVDEVAQTALFLCSGLSSGITGAIIPVDAGYHIMAV
ncbi:MAG: enoyl-ACP reductase [SAR202 cluster bacterium]|nr:enoyl-ACP reductase [SAR202 cluster bacterium]MQG32745.1 enoyl-ACP reductase [SAR202 cluster bacterium]HAA95941.1 NADH-specific enoyl-ACP reductase [Dehalococcoidia bacterium]HCL26075.1 NADH-specific enoyl-ACP reductase [Dehalococcoidia bacterium]HCP23013.1 NADH-specific enoyl-ACP reductase [Dehalococcoidia bacterium]